jgi:hypothetical protein
MGMVAGNGCIGCNGRTTQTGLRNKLPTTRLDLGYKLKTVDSEKLWCGFRAGERIVDFCGLWDEAKQN